MTKDWDCQYVNRLFLRLFGLVSRYHSVSYHLLNINSQFVFEISSKAGAETQSPALFIVHYFNPNHTYIQFNHNDYDYWHGKIQPHIFRSYKEPIFQTQPTERGLRLIHVRIRNHFAQVRASTQDRIVLKEMMSQPEGMMGKDVCPNSYRIFLDFFLWDLKMVTWAA